MVDLVENISHPEGFEDLRPLVSGSLLLPGEEGFDDARSVWNGMIDIRPAAILCCSSKKDVEEGVRFAAARGMPVSIKAGGHNVAGHAVGEGALMLDLSGMRSVEVDPVRRVAHVAGGATWGDVDAATQAHGLVTPGGLISDTGVAGLTLSGGIGWLRSAYGLCIDNLLSAELIDARGNLLRASKEENPDLFWALRGGGGNFGVVVSFEFALHPLGPKLMFCAPIYPVSEGTGPIKFWREFLADKNDVIGSLVEFSTVPETDDFPEEFWGQRCYTIACVYAGDPDEGEHIMQPLREQGRTIADFSGQMDYCDLQKLFDELYPKGAYRCYWKCHLLAELPDEAIEEFLANANASPSDLSISSIWNFGGATGRVPAGETAFGDRGFKYMYSLDSVWSEPGDDGKVIEWTRAAWQKSRKFAYRDRLYLNFAGEAGESGTLVRDAFGRDFSRLQAIKKRYDPENLFRFNQNIDPEA